MTTKKIKIPVSVIDNAFLCICGPDAFRHEMEESPLHSEVVRQVHIFDSLCIGTDGAFLLKQHLDEDDVPCGVSFSIPWNLARRISSFAGTGDVVVFSTGGRDESTKRLHVELPGGEEVSVEMSAEHENAINRLREKVSEWSNPENYYSGDICGEAFQLQYLNRVAELADRLNAGTVGIIIRPQPDVTTFHFNEDVQAITMPVAKYGHPWVHIPDELIDPWLIDP